MHLQTHLISLFQLSLLFNPVEPKSSSSDSSISSITSSVASQASEQAASLSSALASRSSDLNALISELVSGKPPPFTESVYSRFSSAYDTADFYPSQLAASAASITKAAGKSGSSLAAEASKSLSSLSKSAFTPPPALPSILASLSSNVEAAVSQASEAASLRLHGSTKKPAEVCYPTP